MSKADKLLKLTENFEVMKMVDAAPLVKGMFRPNGVMQFWISDPESMRSPHEVTVIKDGDKVVGWSGIGYTRIGRQMLPLVSVFVDPAYRNKGYGQALVKAVLQREQPDIDEPVFYDPMAPQLGKWIDDENYDSEPIPADQLAPDDK